MNHNQILQQGRYAALDITGLEPRVLWELHRYMLRLRRCEEALIREYRVAQEMRCPVHFTLGQEAVPASLALLLEPADFLFSHHRCHGYFLAKGAPMQSLLAELFGRATGANGGLAGSQEISMPSHNFHSGAVLSGALAIAAGAALGIQLRGKPQIAVAGFGEAATEEGIFWEAISYASVRKLPLVYVCENNLYSMYSHLAVRQPPVPLHERVASFGVHTRAIFGNDVAAVYRVMSEAIAQARAGNGPWFLEFYTYRWNAHVGPESDDNFGYRPLRELEFWKANCPIALLEERLTAADLPVTERRQAMLKEIDHEIAAAFAFARSSPFPQPDDLAALNRSPHSPLAEQLLPTSTLGEFDENQPAARLASLLTSFAMRKLTYAQAINEALVQALDMSPDVFVAGQLVDSKPGVFGTTTGLIDRFGTSRIHDFPVSESLMTSVGMGAALTGMRPVLVHHRLDFMLYAADAIVNWLSLWRFKSNGQSHLPITIRAVIGKGWGQGPQHSKSLHAWFAHLPGLKVALPATAHDAKGLLLESIFGEDPAIILENRSLFSMEDEVPEQPYRVPFGQAAVRRPGNDVTLVALGVMVPAALRVAARLATEGVDVEVIDLRTVAPLDRAKVFQSVTKTRRLVVADPAWQSVSVAAEIIASVSEQLGDQLEARPARVCLPDSHTPTSAPLEAAYYPSDDALAAAVRGTIKPTAS